MVFSGWMLYTKRTLPKKGQTSVRGGGRGGRAWNAISHCTQELTGPVVTLTRWNTPLRITDERGALDTPLLPADPLVVPAERRE